MTTTRSDVTNGLGGQQIRPTRSDQILTKFVTVDYVHEGNVRSKFGKNTLTGT